MKIAVISSSAPYGKGESFVIDEVNAIAALGHEVLLIPTQIRRGNPNRFELHDRVRLCAQASFSFRVLTGFCLYALRYPMRLFSMFRLVSDKSLCNSLKNYLVLPKALWLSKHLGQENIEHIHVHWLTTSATLAMLISRLMGVQWSSTAHRGDIVADNLLEKKFGDASFIRFISTSGVALAKARANIAEKKIHVLHLGVSIPDVEDCVENPHLQFVEKPFTIVCPANLAPVKGHHCLLEALAKLKSARKVQLILAGDGDLRDKLSSQTKKTGVQEQVLFKGHVPHSELLSWYRKKLVDLVVLPSLDLGNGLHEGIPVSLMEAMSYGIPVISTRTGGIPELLEDEQRHLEFGVMVEGGNSDELACAIDKMVDAVAARKKWAEMGRTRVIESFNQQRTVRALMKLIEGARHSKRKI